MGLVRQHRRSLRALVASNPSRPAAERTDYVLHSLTLLGPGALFAAVTGILLFASSIIAGRVENWFVFNRPDSALRYHPVFTRRLGMVPAGAGPWISCGQPPQPLQRHRQPPDKPAADHG